MSKKEDPGMQEGSQASWNRGPRHLGEEARCPVPVSRMPGSLLLVHHRCLGPLQDSWVHLEHQGSVVDISVLSRMRRSPFTDVWVPFTDSEATFPGSWVPSPGCLGPQSWWPESISWMLESPILNTWVLYPRCLVSPCPGCLGPLSWTPTSHYPDNWIFSPDTSVPCLDGCIPYPKCLGPLFQVPEPFSEKP